MSSRRCRSRIASGFLVVAGVGTIVPLAFGQEAALPPAVVREDPVRLEERLRQLESLIRSMPDPNYVRKLEERLKTLPDPEHVRSLETSVKQLSGQVEQLTRRLEAKDRLSSAGAGGPATPGGPATSNGGSSETGGAAEEVIGGSAGLSPLEATPTSRFQMPEPIPDFPLKARFGPGFEFKTNDDEFNLQIHDLTQFDGRFYGQANQTQAIDSFAFPRQWTIFSGHMTRPYEYYVSLAEGFDAFQILDVFLNVNYNKAFQFRVGRFKTPFLYEFYAEPTQALANGEWSLFFNNFGYNRDLGGMLWGQLLKDRVDYAAGIFNSTRNGFLDASDPKMFMGFLNFAPFKRELDSTLENFNFGGSVVVGQQNHVPIPQEFRTIVPTSGNGGLGVPFLNLNNNVLASGPQAFWSMHAAWFYQSLSLIGEWQSGFENYALTGRSTQTRVPVGSFYVQGAYLLTGERVASRGLVKPFHPFDLRKGKFGLGAWEVAARYSLLDIGDEVFTAGLADPNQWTNRLDAIDLGVSWYWNQYIRILFDWQHADFGNPVIYRPGAFQSTSNMFIIRFQLWF